MRRALVILGVILAMLVGVGGAANAAPAAPPRPAIELNGVYYLQNVADALWLHASKDRAPMSDSSASAQKWEFVNAHVVHGLSWVQIKLWGTSNGNWCADLDSANNALYLEPCNTGNAWQYFYVPGSGKNNWFVPYEHQGRYLADGDTNNGTGHPIFAYLPGDGNWAVWAGELLN